MGLSGLIGAGAAKGLDAVLAEQLERELFEERKRQALAQEAMASRRLDQGDANMAQDAAQFSEQLGFQRDRAATADARASEEMQQAGIEDMRGQQERQRVNLTRLQNEADVEDAMGGADPVARRVITLRRAGVNAPRGDVMTAGERQSELDAETNADIRRDRARQQAERDFSERPTGASTAASIALDAAKAEAIDTANEAKRLAETLRTHPGMPAAFGVLDSRLPTLRQATADAEEIRNALTSLLTLENTGKLKGVLSNADMRILQQASTTLASRISDRAAKTELDRIVDVMGRAGGSAPSSAAPASAPVTEIEYVRGPNGRLIRRGGG